MSELRTPEEEEEKEQEQEAYTCILYLPSSIKTIYFEGEIISLILYTSRVHKRDNKTS